MPSKTESHSPMSVRDFKRQLDQALGLTENYLSELADRLDPDSSFFDFSEYFSDNQSDTSTGQKPPPNRTPHELGHLALQFFYVLGVLQALDKKLHKDIALWMECFCVNCDFIHELEYLCNCREECSGPPKGLSIKKIRVWLRDALSEFYEASLSSEVLEAIQQSRIAHYQPAIAELDASCTCRPGEESQEDQCLNGCICELQDTSVQPEAVYADAITLSPTSYYTDPTAGGISAESEAVAGEPRNSEDALLIELNRCRSRFTID
ncbi:hypothetical protein FCIRC_7313 [Fusarium circinatum]|uniref:Uncharacterized protein n=1 Tax=Fusarium circinatum TaxID=48490 RepID=A0A8H5TWL6_FUSCI|nr:hypothetical protein FCIRC_7313 [Fusarium circinatum]